MAAAVRASPGPPRRRARTALVAFAVVCLVVAIAAVVRLPASPPARRPCDAGGSEGRQLGVDVLVHPPGQRHGALLHAHDVVPQNFELSFTAYNRGHEPLHLALFGVDADCHVTWLYPTATALPLLPTQSGVQVADGRAFQPPAAGEVQVVALFSRVPLGRDWVEATVGAAASVEAVRDDRRVVGCQVWPLQLLGARGR